VLSVADPATGVVSGTAVYDSFGGRTVTGEAIRYGFTGREHDAESGLIHFRARAYDPATGQFLQRDPIGFAAGDLNLYAYVWNDPYGWTDPSGLGVDNTMTMGGQSALRAVALQGIPAGIGFAVARIVWELYNLAKKVDNDGSSQPSGNDGGDGGGSDPGGDGNDPQRDLIRKIIEGLPQHCLVNFACREFANELIRRLEELEIEHQKITLEGPTGYIFDAGNNQVTSDVYGTGASAIHEGVQVGDVVYDNNYPNGLSVSDWFNNYGVGWDMGPTVVGN
jgi:RHS repeat-associated protein